jgi:hypothetical protein
MKIASFLSFSFSYGITKQPETLYLLINIVGCISSYGNGNDNKGYLKIESQQVNLERKRKKLVVNDI